MPEDFVSLQDLFKKALRTLLGTAGPSIVVVLLVLWIRLRAPTRKRVETPTALPPRKGTVLVELARAEQTTVTNVYDEDALANWVEAHVAKKRAFPDEDDNAS